MKYEVDFRIKVTVDAPDGADTNAVCDQAWRQFYSSHSPDKQPPDVVFGVHPMETVQDAARRGFRGD